MCVSDSAAVSFSSMADILPQVVNNLENDAAFFTFYFIII